MDTGHVDILNRYPVPRHRLNRRDYYRLAEAGILRESDRVELLEGQLIDMSPIGPRHAIVTENLHALLFIACAGRAWVRCQDPVVLDDGSEPSRISPWCAVPGPGTPRPIQDPATSSC